MNKKLLLTSMFSTLMIISCDSTVNYENVESSGKFMPGEDNKLNGNAYVLADDKYMDLVQTSTDAYNAKDWDAMKALYTDDFVESVSYTHLTLPTTPYV